MIEEATHCEKCGEPLDDVRVGTLNNKWYHPECLKIKQKDFVESCIKFMDDVTFCNGCKCMTHSIRKGRASYQCGKCGHDKSLGDYYQWELEE